MPNSVGDRYDLIAKRHKSTYLSQGSPIFCLEGPSSTGLLMLEKLTSKGIERVAAFWVRDRPSHEGLWGKLGNLKQDHTVLL